MTSSSTTLTWVACDICEEDFPPSDVTGIEHEGITYIYCDRCLERLFNKAVAERHTKAIN